jgi:hypothetical protein
MSSARATTVLVVGGTGYFGRLLIEDLLLHTACRIRIGGRSQEALERAGGELGGRVDIKRMDLLQPETLPGALDCVHVAICAAGPFQSLPITLAQACMDCGVHYMDISDDRDFVCRVRALAKSAPNAKTMAAVCSGWSAVPALSAALVHLAAEGMERVDEIFIQISPGNRFPRAQGTVVSLLASVGKPFTVWRDQRWEIVTGWSAARPFDFPNPMGRRFGFLVDVPDHEIFPDLFGAKRVEFRVGSELNVLNRGMSALAWITRRGIVRDWRPSASILRHVMGAFRFVGHEWGAVGVEVTGGAVRRRACVVAERSGQRIPVMPAAVMTAKLLSEECPFHGLAPLDTWIDGAQMRTECESRGFRLVVETEKI